MMAALDFIPALLAFTFAVLGIVGRTKDDTKTGIKRVTKIGWLFLVLSAVTMALGFYSVRVKQIALDKRATVAGIVRGRVINGFDALLRPLCGSEQAFTAKEPAELFETLRSKDNLGKVGGMRAVKWQDSPGRIVSQISSLPYKDFENLFELNDYYITKGEAAIESALGSFGGYLSDDEVIALSSVVSDPFLNGDYNLTGLAATYFAQGLADEKQTEEQSPWVSLGTYWFRAGDLGSARDFLSKSESAISMILSRSPSNTYLNPCQR